MIIHAIFITIVIKTLMIYVIVLSLERSSIYPSI